MRNINSSGSSKPLTLYTILVLLILLTAAYSYFVLFSTEVVHIFITDSNTNPSLLFNLMVKPYIVWIIAAWVSLLINTRWVFTFIKNQMSEGHLSGSLIHIAMLFTAFLFHLVALFSPFITQAFIIE